MEKMDRREKQNRKVRRRPGVPLKTYKWEDVYRSRRKGGYPWTHLYKEPFDEELDPEEYTMEALRRSKSNSTFDRSERSDGVEIEEIFDDDRSNNSTTKQFMEVVEPDFDSKSDQIVGENKMFTIESADSSDNISQYLDKEERGPEKESTQSQGDETEERQARAISEEPPRKRKLSGESSYSKISRLSLPKFAALKKLSKQKFSKISFPTSNIKRSKVPKKSSPPQTKKEVKQKVTDFKNVKPVYIHIPLKPPPGETDEFSYLEFEEKKPKVEAPQEVPSFRSLVKAIKKAQEQQEKEKLEKDVKEDDKKEPTPAPADDVEVMDFTLQEPEPEPKPEEKLKMEPPEEKIIDSFDVVKVVHLKSETERAPAEVIDVIEEKNEVKLPAQVSSPDVDETEPESEMSSNENDPDMFEKLFQADTKKENEPISTKPIIRSVRAKSAEPERKRKMSLESSYSRKSLSKLAFLKKIRDAKNKIKFPSLGNLIPKKQPKEKVKEKVDETPKPSTSKKDKLAPVKPVEPVYIHIPLKPPEGQQDEFSYLENEPLGVAKMEVDKPEKVEEAPNESPDSVKAEGVQFIFLTAPSDDELLDGPDVPETPSSETKMFSFAQRVDELKELAKEVVDEISPDTKRKVLDPVTEEANEDRADEFDKEDGLKITEAEAKSEQIKSSLKQEGSPLLKKKVSFKRRSKDSKDSKDDDYEEITPKDDTLGVPSILAENPEEKVEESASPPDETARWSKISDHDYEPVNPPPEEKEPVKTSPKIIQEIPKVETHEDIISSAPTALTETQVTVTTHETSLPLFPSSLSSKYHQTVDDLEDEDVPQKETKPPSTLKLKAGQFKTKLQNIKKPKFQKPNLQKFKIERPKFNLPKIPDTARINLPSFSLPHRSTTKVTIKERQQSTESNVGDSKKHTFDFKNYFKRKHDDEHDIGDPSHFTTSEETERSKSVERSTGYDASAESQSDAHPAESKKFDFSTFPRFFKKSKEGVKEKKQTSSYYEPKRSKSTEPEVIRIPLHSEDSMENGYNDKNEPYDIDEPETINSPSLIRYNEDIDIDDGEYSPENMEIPDEGFKSRWEHGHFSNKVTDLDSPESPNNQNESFDLSANTDIHSSHSSLDLRRRGVLEEINSDEFFLRQKGISQDNIEVGKYLSSEIREAFKIPVNTLSDMQSDKYDAYDLGSNQSLPDVQPKKKPARKPKRKKTPHASEDEIKYHDYDLDVEITPTRPKRNGSKPKNLNLLDEQDIKEIMSRYTEEDKPYYENEKMRGKEQPNIYVDSASEHYRVAGFEPEAPPRKHRSLRSLNLSEHESILGEFNDRPVESGLPSNVEQEIDEENRYFKDKYNTYPLPQTEHISPVRPKRRSKSRKSSKSRSSSQVQSILQDSEPISEPQSVVEEPCVEEPCRKVLGDYMGYAVIDKSKIREPPLPPPRTPPRRRRSIKSTSSDKFSTVPRSEPPTRPLRNYSTLGQIKTSRRSSLKSDVDKENIDITQYIEVDDGSRNLVSGEIIQKMKDRPLPAPPRPPRKSRVLKDITSEQNIPALQHDEEKGTQLEEVDMSTQTEPLPDDFICEDDVKTEDEAVVRKKIISTPTHYTYEETVTHGTLLVEPLNGAKILRDEDLQVNERVIPVTLDSDDDYPSQVPTEFNLLKDPPRTDSTEPQNVRIIPLNEPISDLEVGRLRVNELHANKIIVSDIESENIQVNQLSGKSGVLKISDIELPPSVIQEIVKNVPVPEPIVLTEEATEYKPDVDVRDEPVLLEEDINLDIEVREEEPLSENPDHSIPANSETLNIESSIADDEKKQPPTPPPRTSDSLRLQPDLSDQAEENVPLRPPRQNRTDNSDVGTPLGEPDIDDFPPPRPPQPNIGYIPSQPPASFYALRAQKYVNEDIPAAAPRRRRHQRHVSRSSSEESPVVHSSRKHFRSPEPSIPQLTGQLIRACSSAGNDALKRLIAHIKENIIRNEDGQQDLHVVIIILLVLIAGLLLLGIGDEKTVVHLHHWEYFNPPKDM